MQATDQEEYVQQSHVSGIMCLPSGIGLSIHGVPVSRFYRICYHRCHPVEKDYYNIRIGK